MSGAFTDSETVITQKCGGDLGFVRELGLPRFDDSELTKRLDQMVQELEDKINRQLVTNPPTSICVVNGAIVLDGHQNNNFEVTLDADINSISFINFDRPGQKLNVLFNSSGDFSVHGFPENIVCPECGTIQDRLIFKSCTRLPLSFRTNLDGNPTSVTRGSGPNCVGACVKAKVLGGASIESAITDCFDICGENTIASENTGSDAACICTPDQDEEDPPTDLLTIIVCAELDCEAENPKIEITVCGGVPPYQWTIAGERSTVTITQSGTNNKNVTVTPPEETVVAGTAYRTGFEITKSGGACSCTCSAFQFSEPFDCSGESLGNCAQTALGEGTFPINCEDDTLGNCGLFPNSTPGDPCDNCARSGIVDLRTQGMKDAGCVPCELLFEGATITVEDDAGTKVVTTLSTI